MKNIQFYTIDVLFAKLPTPKGNHCLHVDIWYSTLDIGSCLWELDDSTKYNLCGDTLFKIRVGTGLPKTCPQRSQAPTM